MKLNNIFSNPSCVQGALINGLEARVNLIEEKLSDLDARGSEESDNLANERNLDRFIMSGECRFFPMISWWFFALHQILTS